MGSALDLVVLAFVVLSAVWFIGRGLQNGILLIMVAAMRHTYLVHSRGFLPHLTLDRVVWPLVLLIFLVKWKQRKLNKLSPDLVEYSMCALMAVIVISMYVNGTYVSIANEAGVEKLNLTPLLNGFLFPFTIYFIARRGVQTAAQVQSFLIGVGLITLYLIISSLGEVSHQDWLVFPKDILDPDLGIHFGKVRGPFLNASFNGLAIAMGLPIFAWLFFVQRGVSRWLWPLGATLAVIPLVFSFQRAVWLGVVAALGVMALAWSRQRVILIGLLVLVAAGGFSAASDNMMKRLSTKLGEQETIDFRFLVLEKTQEVVLAHPVTGLGFGTFNDYVSPFVGGVNSHNTPLTLLAELGLVGFLPYLMIFALLALKSLSAYWRQPQSRVMITVLWGVTAAYVAVSIAGELRLAAYLNMLLFALWGVLLEAVRRQSAVANGQGAIPGEADRALKSFV